MYLMLEMLSKMSDPDMLKSLEHLLVQVKVLLIIEIGNKNISLEYSGIYKIIALLHILRHMISMKNSWIKNYQALVRSKHH